MRRGYKVEINKTKERVTVIGKRKILYVEDSLGSRFRVKKSETRVLTYSDIFIFGA